MTNFKTSITLTGNKSLFANFKAPLIANYYFIAVLLPFFADNQIHYTI